MTTCALAVGDCVRVRRARRRDVIFVVAEIGENTVRATNDRGAEAIYAPEAFERVGGSVAVSSPTRATHRAYSPEIIPDASTVRARAGENIDDLLRRFKKSVQRSGMLYDLRKHAAFESKPQRRRAKSRRARVRRGDTS